jgi:plastocyanin
MSSRTATRNVLSVFAAFVLVLTLAAPSNAATVRVRGRNSSWHPQSVSINRGSRVVWRAVDRTHTVTAYRGDWSKNTTISAGERTRFTFNSAGRYKYRCTLHSSLSNGVCNGMCGRVVVG